MLYKTGAIFMIALFLAGCSESDKADKKTEVQNPEPALDVREIKRWYKPELISIGQPLFQQNCAVCHGKQAEGVIHPWNQKLPGGTYPPPPLNGSAHAWHHPLKALVFTVSNGGAPVGGQMPAFKDKLSQEEQLAIIAYFQDFWSDKVYQAWLDRGGLKI